MNCSECGKSFDGDAYTIISDDGADTICGDCHALMREWTDTANAAIRKALGHEAN